jgi:hypothetical protein
MLATIVFYFSAAVAILALLDLFLSDSQKVALSNTVVGAWSLLDEARGWSFADWLNQRRAKWWLAIGPGVFSAGSMVFYYRRLFELRRTIEGIPQPEPPLFGYIMSVWIVFILITLVSRPIIAHVLKLNSGKHFWLKLWLLLLGSVALYDAALFGLLDPLKDKVSDSIFTLAIFALLPLSFLALSIMAIFMAWVVAYAATIMLFVGEFVVRRIAEYPKGPILALSALLGGIIALVKSLG